MSIAILKETIENCLCFARFKQGDEKALMYIHQQTCKPLQYHASRFIDDRFVVNSMIQDVYVKAWNMRDKIENMYHLYCFMRINLSWSCLSWLKHPGNIFYRKKLYYTHEPEALETQQLHAAVEIAELSHLFDEERLRTIEMVLPYLPPDRQTMLDLYFKKGLSYKAIARRFGSTHYAVREEVQRGLNHLKKMIHRQKKTVAKEQKHLPEKKLPPVMAMDVEMAQIFRLRVQYKMGFIDIAEKMNLEQIYVQRKYVEAQALAHKLKIAV